MSMTDIILDITHEMVGDKDEFVHMNSTLPHHGQAYIQKDYKNGELYVMCPYCGKKNLMIKDNTSISNIEMKCKGSNCKKIFLVNIKDGKEIM